MPNKDVDIVRFDPRAASRADWSAMHVYRRARSQEAAPDDPIPSDEQFEEDSRDRDPHGERLRFVARSEGAIVGSAWSFLFHPDSPNFAERARFLDAHFAVLAPWRGCGIGTRLLAAVHKLMLAHDKRTLTLATHEPDGHGFLRHLGAAEKICSLENRLSIGGVDWTALARWESAALGPCRERGWSASVPEFLWICMHPCRQRLRRFGRTYRSTSWSTRRYASRWSGSWSGIASSIAWAVLTS